jgi:hypothetical protein
MYPEELAPQLTCVARVGHTEHIGPVHNLTGTAEPMHKPGVGTWHACLTAAGMHMCAENHLYPPDMRGLSDRPWTLVRACVDPSSGTPRENYVNICAQWVGPHMPSGPKLRYCDAFPP